MSLSDCCKPESAQSHYSSENDKANEQIPLAYNQRLAGDTAGAKVTAEQARSTLEQRYKGKPDDPHSAAFLAKAYALMGEKELALKLAQRATMLVPRGKDPVMGPTFEEDLALVQTLVGENNSAISTLSKLLQTAYESNLYYPTGVTPALLRLDPIWDPLRGDPAFQKLCEEKQPPATP